MVPDDAHAPSSARAEATARLASEAASQDLPTERVVVAATEEARANGAEAGGATVPPAPTPDLLDALPPDEAFRAYVEEVRATEDIERSPREAERVELEQPLRAVLDLDARRLGRVTRVSASSLWIETHHPLLVGAAVSVELSLLGGHALGFRGAVVRSASGGMGIRLETDDTTEVFRSSFVEMARARTLGRRPEIRLTSRSKAAHHDDLAPLWAAWRKAEGALHDDAAQQRFIQACLGGRRLEFALERYRAVRVAQPGRPEAERYLQQIGTLLGFSGLAPVDRDDLGARARRMKVAALVIVILALGGLITRGASADRDPPASPPVEATLEDPAPISSEVWAGSGPRDP